MKIKTTVFVTAALAAWTTPAFAASDVFLEIDGVQGEILAYSWGMSQPSSVASSSVTTAREAGSGMATGRRSSEPRLTASQNSQSLRSTGGVQVSAGDLNGDGRADFLDATRVAEVDSFSLVFDKASPVLARMCATGTHIPKASIRSGADVFDIVDAHVATCGAPPSAARAHDSMPQRISMNVTVPRQTQGATFGEKCSSGVCAPSSVAVTFTGQFRHTKTGHVTILR